MHRVQTPKHLSLQRLCSSTIISGQVMPSQKPRLYQRQKKMAHIIGDFQGFQATLSLNRQHKYNVNSLLCILKVLTPTMIEEMTRFLESYNLDDLVKVVWMNSTDHSMLSKGTDLKFILHKVKEKEDHQAVLYLSEIQKLAAYIAGYQKIFIPILNGDISGSLAAMLVNSPFSLSSQNVQLRISESLSGFALHGGASYALSRLPSEVGVYLALTGRKLNSQELHELQLVAGQLENINDAKSIIYDLQKQQQRFISTDEYYGNQLYRQELRKHQAQKLYYEKVQEEIENRIFNPTLENQEDAKLTMTEILYKNELMKYHNRTIIPKQQIANYSVQFENLFLDHLIDSDIITQNKQRLPYEQISRCFSANSVFEIEKRLKDEQSEWATNCLKEIQKRSPLCNELSLQLIRKAEQSDFIQCLENEFKVAVKLLKENDLEYGVETNIRKMTSSGQWKHKSAASVSKSEVESFFDSNTSLNLLQNQFLPAKAFYQDYPDNIRFFLNEQSLNAPQKERADQEVDVYSFLKNYNYPVDDQSLKVETIRNVFLSFEEKQRKLEAKIKKLQDLCVYPESLRKFYEKRRNHFREQFKNGELIEKKLEETIKNHFQGQLNKRMNSVQQVAEIAHFKQKMDLFSSVRNAIVNHRLTVQEGKGFDPQRWASLKFGLYFPDKNDQSFLSTFHKAVDDPTLFSSLWKIKRSKPDIFDFHEVEYRTRYGDTEKEMNLKKYHQKLLKAGSTWETISKFIEANGDQNTQKLLEMNRIRTEEEIQATIEDLYQDQMKGLDKHKEVVSEHRAELIKEMKEEMKSLSFSEQLGHISSLKEVRSNLQSYIKEDAQLKELLKPLFEPVHPFCADLQKSSLNLLSLIYNGKIEQFTSGHRTLPTKKDNPFDLLLTNEVERDVNKLVESHVFFTFSYLLIKELERYYLVFTHSPKNSDTLAQMTNQLGLKITTDEQLDQFLDYLNSLVRVSSSLYETYRDNLYFTTDKNLYAYIKLKQFKRKGKNVFEDHLFSSQTIVSKIENRKQVALAEVDHEKSMDEITNEEILEVIERPWIDEQRQNKFQNQSLTKESYYSKGHYEATVLNSVMRMIKKKQKNRRELVLGIDHYLSSADKLATQASFEDKHMMPQEISNKMLDLDKAEAQLKWFNQEQSLEEWFSQKFEEAIADIFWIRKQYESRLSGEALQLFDEEISSLLEVEGFERVFEQSFQEDMRLVNKWGRQMQVLRLREEDRQIQSQKLPYNTHMDEVDDVSLFTTVEGTKDLTQVRENVLNREMSKKHPLSRATQLKSVKASEVSEDVEIKKIQKDLNEGVNIVAEGMYKAHVTLDDAHDELEKLYQRIQFRNESKIK